MSEPGNGRNRYTLVEDYKIYEFLVQRIQKHDVLMNTPFGNQLWAKAEHKHITLHSQQSMRDRCRRVLLKPDCLSRAAIPIAWRKKIAERLDLQISIDSDDDSALGDADGDVQDVVSPMNTTRKTQSISVKQSSLAKSSTTSVSANNSKDNRQSRRDQREATSSTANNEDSSIEIDDRDEDEDEQNSSPELRPSSKQKRRQMFNRILDDEEEDNVNDTPTVVASIMPKQRVSASAQNEAESVSDDSSEHSLYIKRKNTKATAAAAANESLSTSSELLTKLDKNIDDSIRQSFKVLLDDLSQNSNDRSASLPLTANSSPARSPPLKQRRRQKSVTRTPSPIADSHEQSVELSPSPSRTRRHKRVPVENVDESEVLKVADNAHKSRMDIELEKTAVNGGVINSSASSTLATPQISDWTNPKSNELKKQKLVREYLRKWDKNSRPSSTNSELEFRSKQLADGVFVSEFAANVGDGKFQKIVLNVIRKRNVPTESFDLADQFWRSLYEYHKMAESVGVSIKEAIQILETDYPSLYSQQCNLMDEQREWDLVNDDLQRSMAKRNGK